jgi:Flp pilus assembly protein TadG
VGRALDGLVVELTARCAIRAQAVAIGAAEAPAARQSRLRQSQMRQSELRAVPQSQARDLLGCVAALWRDTCGIILPYVTILLVVIIGVAALALDGARYMSLQTQLQNGADALALAGAAELDRLPDAEGRAVNAINSLLKNSSLFGTGADRNVRIASIQFYSRLPDSDARPMSEAIPATDGTNARFVAVTVRPMTLATILPTAFFGGASLVTTGASAVAGFDQVVCNVTPLFVCNPFEADGMSYVQATQALQEGAADPTHQRRLILLRQNGGTDPYVPGDYGFLDADGLGADNVALIDSLARVHPTACFRQNGVNIRPSFVAGVRDALNVRFDIYGNSMVGNRNNPDYRPALNVRKGYVGGSGGTNSCSAQPATSWPIGAPPNQATGLPLDNGWTNMGGRMGNGNWDFDTYWQVNHGGAGRQPPSINGNPVNNSNLVSRYAVYRYEIEQGMVEDRSPGGENGAPACYGGGFYSDAPDRRILQAAVLNCLSLDLNQGPQAALPVAAFAKLFLTLPLAPSQTNLFVETVGLVNPSDRTVNFDAVQLYR